MKKRFSLSLCGLIAVFSYSNMAQALLPSGSDNFADASVITSQNDVSGFTNLLGATEEVDEPKHRPDSAPGDGQTVWWKWTAPENGFCTVDTLTPASFNNPLLDTVLSVYTGTALNALTRVAANDDHASFYFSNNYGQSKATFFATAGVTYYMAVDGPYDGVIAPTGFGTVLRLRQVPARALTRRALWAVGSSINGVGMLTMTTTATGGYSAVFQQGATKYAFAGIFDRDGYSVRSVIPAKVTGQPQLPPITLRMDGAGTGLFSIETNSINYGDRFPRQIVYAKTTVNPLLGVYNLGGDFATQDHHERGWVQATVSATGTVACAGRAPDGLSFTASTAMCEVAGSTDDFKLPAFTLTSSNKGYFYFSGNATLLTSPSNDPEISADCQYLRPQAPAAAFHPTGYGGSFTLKGRRYVKPALNSRVMNFLLGTNPGSGELRIRDSFGEMAGPISELVNFNTANKFVFATPLPRKVSLNVNTTNGLVTGSITTTDTILGVTKARARSLQGLIFREGPNTWLRGYAAGVTKNLYMEVVNF
jgi:hypothetical protein